MTRATTLHEPKPMALPYLIIDGYNLMHAMGIARSSYGPGDLERCRVRLQSTLKTVLSTEVQQMATIVYDAFTSTSDEQRHHSTGVIQIVFAPKGTDADSEIERMLQQHSVPKRVVVVSSDHRLHKAAARRKAKCVDSEVFWDSLETQPADTPVQRKPNRNAPKARPKPKGEDLQHWMKQFEGAADAGETENAASDAFDEGYLSDLEDDLQRGDL